MFSRKWLWCVPVLGAVGRDHTKSSDEISAILPRGYVDGLVTIKTSSASGSTSDAEEIAHALSARFGSGQHPQITYFAKGLDGF